MSTDEEWRASASPAEDWDEGGNENGEWPLKGIVGEEVDLFGVSRYEVRWDNWQRPDGTSTTWQREVPGCLSWTRHQKAYRLNESLTSLDIPVPVFTSMQIQNANTALKKAAYEEKMNRYKSLPRSTQSWTDEIRKVARDVDDEARRQAGEEVVGTPRALRASTTRPKNTGGSRLSRSHSTTSTLASTSTPRSAAATLSIASTPTKVGGRSALPSPSPARSTPRPLPPPPYVYIQTRPGTPGTPRPINPLPARARSSGAEVLYPKRAALQKAWNKATREARAERVILVNELNDDEIPELVKGFKYIETGYIPDKDIPIIDDECFLRCECSRTCEDASRCSCRQLDMDDDDKEKFGDVQAYDEEGLFTFDLPLGVEVIECNKFCACRINCPNRVAQRPREIPIEVFKTLDRGWGARATVSIEKGRVLGIYTGKLIRRETSHKLTNKSYMFDLDSKEVNGEDNGDTNKFSVDSYECGNWTRFVNHSCEPNTRVYPVVCDTIPEMNMPYHVFVALTDIPARTELTLDYDPAAARSKGKGKSRSKLPHGARPCRCESDNCRGYVNV